jgi:hypothetical protein
MGAGLQRKHNFQLVAIDHESYSALPPFDSQAMQEGSQFKCVTIEVCLTRVALNQHGGIEEKLAALRIVAPHTAPLRKCRRSAEEFSEHRKRFSNPEILSNRPPKSILAWNEKDKQC